MTEQYRVIDIRKNEIVTVGGRQDIIDWWKNKCRCTTRKNNPSFQELNITGKDTYLNMVPDSFNIVTIDSMAPIRLTNYIKKQVLRPYQVLDEFNRPVDIRLWPKSEWDREPENTYYWFGSSGSKYHRRRANGPTMWRRTLTHASNKLDIEELDDLPTPIRNRSDIKLPFNQSGDILAYYERHHYRRTAKSWKHQTKARKPWAKHKPGTHRPMRKLDMLEREWTEEMAYYDAITENILEYAS